MADHWQPGSAPDWAPWGRAIDSDRRDLVPGPVWLVWDGSLPAEGILLVNELRVVDPEGDVQPVGESDGNSLAWYTVEGPDPELSWPEARALLLERAATTALAASGWGGEKILATLDQMDLWDEVPAGFDWIPEAHQDWGVGLDESRLLTAVARRLTLEGAPVRVSVEGWESTGLDQSHLSDWLDQVPGGAPRWQWVDPGPASEGGPDLTIHAELVGKESGEEPSRLPGRTKPWTRISVRIRFETRWGPDLEFQVTGPRIYGRTSRLDPEDLVEQAPDTWSAWWLALSLNQE